jgi:shikimate kinase
VVALGGGAFVTARNRKLICEHGIVIYLQCAVRELYRRLSRVSDRPLLNVRPREGQTARQARMERAKHLLARRQATYRMADATVSTTNKSVSAVVEEILGKLEEFNADHPRKTP